MSRALMGMHKGLRLVYGCLAATCIYLGHLFAYGLLGQDVQHV
jgi:hypothetical protein